MKRITSGEVSTWSPCGDFTRERDADDQISPFSSLLARTLRTWKVAHSMLKTFKVSHTASPGQPPVLRKFTIETDGVTLLFGTVQHRFQFDPSWRIELFYRDQDGDLITLVRFWTRSGQSGDKQ